MTRRWRGAALCVGVFLTLACSGFYEDAVDEDGPFDNAGACRAWVTASNALACMAQSTIDIEDQCPVALNRTDVDLTGYYRCMEKNARCSEDAPDLSGQIDCKKPSM